MKLALPVLLSASTIPSTSALLPALQLGSDLPDSRFRVDLIFDAPLLPVSATLINILHFMSLVARQEFDEDLQPRICSAPMYPQVQVVTYAWTEARFLLWGIYLAAVDMVKYIRFHEVLIKLYWENAPVGQIKLVVRAGLNLSASTTNGTGSILDYGGQMSLAGVENKTAQAFVQRYRTPPVQNITGGETADNTSAIWTSAFSISSPSPTLVFPDALLPPRFRIEFARVAGATRLSRNEVFLTAYAAMLHMIRFPAENQMQPFGSNSPTSHLRLHMYESGIGCLVIPITSLLSRV